MMLEIQVATKLVVVKLKCSVKVRETVELVDSSLWVSSLQPTHLQCMLSFDSWLIKIWVD